MGRPVKRGLAAAFCGPVFLWLFVALGCATGTAGVPRCAVLHRGALTVRDAGGVRVVAKDVDTFGWDRDGRTLLVTQRDALRRLAPGGEMVTLTDGWDDVRFPVASPDGRRIAFAGKRDGSEWKAWTCARDGSDVREVAEGYGPAWAADGRTLYFERHGDAAGIYRLERATGAITRFRKDAYTVSCSPDGRYVAFSDAGVLYLHEVATGKERALTLRPPDYARFLSFAPDGRRGAWFRERGSRQEVVVGDLDGEEPPVVVGPGELILFAPR